MTVDDSGGSPPPIDAAVPPDLQRAIGADQTVSIFDHQGFVNPGGSHDAMAMLPDGLFAKILLHIDLGCAAGGCDPYDRIAQVGVVIPGPATDAGPSEQFIEIGRFITPFGVKGKWDIDVTDLRPLFVGAQKFRTTIYTYAAGGKGWTVTASLVYTGGVPAKEAVAAVALPWASLPVGNPTMQTTDAALPPTKVTLPAGVTSSAVRLFVTGHGQGNAANCAEFCDLNHSVLVDGKLIVSQSIYRTDCDQNPLNRQLGTWQAPREGWCPGEDVTPWLVDLGARTGTFTVSYGDPTVNMGGVDMPYVNTCQPNNCIQRSCAFGNPCAYDGGSHTDPNFAVTAVVIGYR